MSASTTHPRIVIIGGGFSGIFAARHLRRRIRNARIELINERNYFVFQPLLPEVVASIINIQDAVTPLRLVLPDIRVRLAEVTHIEFAANKITLLQGRKQVPISVGYDHLVIACGLISDLARFPGFAEHTLSMKHVSDAYALRNRIINCLEHADITSDATIKKALTTFVVIGGGFSGVETMGEMSEMLRRTLPFYKNIPREMVKFVLIQRGNRILPELPESLGRYVDRKLSERGIDVRCNTGMKKALLDGVVLSDGSMLPSYTVVTTIGNGPSPFTQSLGLKMQRGRIETDPYLRVPPHDNVWSLGDVAAVPLMRRKGEEQRYAPPTAQFAVQEAKCLANNMARTIRAAHKRKARLRPFSYKPKGALASIGNYRAVAQIMGVNISGFVAWFLWRGFYMALLPGHISRLRVALNWLLDYFIPRSIVQVEQSKQHSCRYIHLHKGTVLFRPNERVHGLYTVISGKMESRAQRPNGDGGGGADKDYVRELNPGDHWGERSIHDNRYTHDELRALEDSVLLLMERTEFSRLREGLPVLRDYFDNIPEQNYPPQLRQERDSVTGTTGN